MPDRDFPSHLVRNEPERRARLLRLFYEAHHRENRNIHVGKDLDRKLRFFQDRLCRHQVHVQIGVDLGCRGATLTQGLLPFGHWIGVDIDSAAVAAANQKGIPCREADISVAIDFLDDAFDAVCMTEVLEHLPYPSVTICEVHRILKKQPGSVFFGSVPIDYHLHRRFHVFRGGRLNADPTHLRSFSFSEVKALLDYFFEEVEFEPLRGTKVRHRWLSWDHFVRDVAWFARGPKPEVCEFSLKSLESTLHAT
jgi:SAM-dependent methyltransferase